MQLVVILTYSVVYISSLERSTTVRYVPIKSSIFVDMRSKVEPSCCKASSTPIWQTTTLLSFNSYRYLEFHTFLDSMQFTSSDCWAKSHSIVGICSVVSSRLGPPAVNTIPILGSSCTTLSPQFIKRVQSVPLQHVIISFHWINDGYPRLENLVLQRNNVRFWGYQERQRKYY